MDEKSHFRDAIKALFPQNLPVFKDFLKYLCNVHKNISKNSVKFYATNEKKMLIIL